MAASLAVPTVPPNLTGIERRRAVLARTSRLLELQVAAEEALAAELPLDDAARLRVVKGSPSIVSVELTR